MKVASISDPEKKTRQNSFRDHAGQIEGEPMHGDRVATCFVESVYSDEQRELLVAVQAHQQRHGRKFLTYCEILDVVKSLGFVRDRDSQVAVPNDPVSELPLPHGTARFRKAWTEFCEYRRATASPAREPLWISVAQRYLKFLGGMCESRAVASMREAITCGYLRPYLPPEEQREGADE